MSLNKLNNRCITNNFLKGDRGPPGPPGELPYYTIKSSQQSDRSWTFDLSVLPCVIRSSNGLKDSTISYMYEFTISETADTLPPILTTPSCGKIDWIDAGSNIIISDLLLNDLGRNIKIDGEIVNELPILQNYAFGTLLGKETNITSSNFGHRQSVMFYYHTEYSSDLTLSTTNSCTLTSTLNSFTYSSSEITKNAYTTLHLDIGGDPTPTSKYLYLRLTPLFLFSSR